MPSSTNPSPSFLAFDPETGGSPDNPFGDYHTPLESDRERRAWVYDHGALYPEDIAALTHDELVTATGEGASAVRFVSTQEDARGLFSAAGDAAAAAAAGAGHVFDRLTNPALLWAVALVGIVYLVKK